MPPPPDLATASMLDSTVSRRLGGGAPEDETVVARILEGETALFEVLMRRYNQRLYRVIRSMTTDATEAEDILQETYLRAFAHLWQFQRRARFSTWLTRIAVHATTARRRRRRPTLLGEADMSRIIDESPQGTSPEAQADTAELGRLLRQAVEALPGQLRVVFVLRAIEELDTEETAACLGMTPSNVKVRLHRARAVLRRSLEARLGTEVKTLYAFDGTRCDRIVRRVLARLATGPRA